MIELNYTPKLPSKIEPASVVGFTDGKKIEFDWLTNEQNKFVKSVLKDSNHHIFNDLGCLKVVVKLEKMDNFKLHESLRKLGHTLSKELNKNKVGELLVCSDSDEAFSFVEGLILSNYQFLKYFKKRKQPVNTLKKVQIVSKDKNQKSAKQIDQSV